VSHCALCWLASPRALLFKKYCRIIHLFLRSMSGLSLLLPLRPRKRIYQSRACPLLSEGQNWYENIPVALVEALTLLGHDVQTVIGQGLTGRTDREIWTQCQLEDRLLITQDLDFRTHGSFNQEATQELSLFVCKIPGAPPCRTCSVRFSEVMISKPGKGALSSFQKQKFE